MPVLGFEENICLLKKDDAHRFEIKHAHKLHLYATVAVIDSLPYYHNACSKQPCPGRADCLTHNIADCSTILNHRFLIAVTEFKK